MGRKIGCCGAKVWTRVIGALNGAAQFIHIVFDIMRFPDESMDKGLRLMSLAIITCNLIGLGFSTLLFKGSVDKKPEYLHAWMIVATVTFAFFSLLVPGTLIIGEWVFSIAFVFSAAIIAFCVWVVSVHKEELVAGLKSDLNPI
ncbi:unnamed protein product [Allacma fusca]|uniref:Uncharacterized protein n=1 Tax=Allacma fusca TaxID=39272 RepID=A0A8J2KZT0_9HEXA|nr:unnamed protein product [Allacma fusca]